MHIDFGADPIGVDIKLSCLHNTLCINGWILTTFSWIYNWDITRNWLYFGDLDLFFQVEAVEKLKIHSAGRGMGHLFSLKTMLTLLLIICN